MAFDNIHERQLARTKPAGTQNSRVPAKRAARAVAASPARPEGGGAGGLVPAASLHEAALIGRKYTLGGLPRTHMATLIPQTADALAAENSERGRTPVLVIDEAHLLDHAQLVSVLRSPIPALIAQEFYALLTVYQVLRHRDHRHRGRRRRRLPRPGQLHHRRADSPGPDHAGRERHRRDQIDLIGTIGGHRLDNLMPARRLRVSPRAVKRPLSRYAYKSRGVDRRSYLATITIDLVAGQPALTCQGDP